MTARLTAPLDTFKAREIEILELMAEGYSNTEIADQLFVTRETIRWYNKQIYSKLGTSRRTEAIALAREMGLIGENEEPQGNKSPRVELPVTTGPFIGRDQDIADLTELIRKPEIRLISVIAAGGMGKSRISLELGHQLQAQFKHGAVFFDLTSLNDPNDVAELVLNSFGLKANSKQGIEDLVVDYCREKEMLLIFDNFEHVLPAASLLAKLLESSPTLKIIATSRERLNLRIETAYFLEPVYADGVELFTEVALMMHSNIEILESDEPDIKRIVKIVG
ncbi:MAG: LuxR C-terminal-related transcriptional regulator, partial [Chloroflexota bacterium]